VIALVLRKLKEPMEIGGRLLRLVPRWRPASTWSTATPRSIRNRSASGPSDSSSNGWDLHLDPSAAASGAASCFFAEFEMSVSCGSWSPAAGSSRREPEHPVRSTITTSQPGAEVLVTSVSATEHTFLFCDLVGFTALTEAEGTSAQRVAGTLQLRVQDVASHHGARS